MGNIDVEIPTTIADCKTGRNGYWCRKFLIWIHELVFKLLNFKREFIYGSAITR
jgi:hypothetical protein